MGAQMNVQASTASRLPSSKPRMRSRVPTPQETNRAPITNSVPGDVFARENGCEMPAAFEPVPRDGRPLEFIQTVEALVETRRLGDRRRGTFFTGTHQCLSPFRWSSQGIDSSVLPAATTSDLSSRGSLDAAATIMGIAANPGGSHHEPILSPLLCLFPPPANPHVGN